MEAIFVRYAHVICLPASIEREQLAVVLRNAGIGLASSASLAFKLQGYTVDCGNFTRHCIVLLNGQFRRTGRFLVAGGREFNVSGIRQGRSALARSRDL